MTPDQFTAGLAELEARLTWRFACACSVDFLETPLSSRTGPSRDYHQSKMTPELITAVLTILLFLVTWRAANAAKQNAETAAREFRLLRRPLVAVTWSGDSHVAGDTDVLLLNGIVKEVAGFATTLHSYEVRATPLYDLDTPLVYKEDRSTLLSGDVAVRGLLLSFQVPHWYRDGQPKPSTAAKRAPAGFPGTRPSIAHVVITVVISAADEDATREEWQLRGVLVYERTQKRYVLPEKMYSECLGERGSRRRSRIVDPMLRAWERWWDSVC